MWRGALAALLVAACDDAAPTCTDPPARLRNPSNLHCDLRPVPSPTCPVGALPSWAPCDDACLAILDEAVCAVTPGCRVAYDDCVRSGDPCYTEPFLGCLAIDRSGPTDGACAGLDAQACSAREHCASWFLRGGQCPPGPGPGEHEERAHQLPDNEPCFLAFAYCEEEPRY